MLLPSGVARQPLDLAIYVSESGRDRLAGEPTNEGFLRRGRDGVLMDSLRGTKYLFILFFPAWPMLYCAAPIDVDRSRRTLLGVCRNILRADGPYYDSSNPHNSMPCSLLSSCSTLSPFLASPPQ